MSSIVQPIYVDNSANGFSFAESVDPLTGVVDTSTPTTGIDASNIVSPVDTTIVPTIVPDETSLEVWMESNLYPSLLIGGVVLYFLWKKGL